MARPTSRHLRGRPCDHGAAAVEFALVLPILLLILFGIVDYGLYFSDSFSARSGVEEAARQGSVAAFDAHACDHETLTLDTSTSTPSADVKDLMCAAVADAGDLTGHVDVAVVVPAGGWAVGKQLLVCGLVHVDGITGYTPLPGDGYIQIKNVVTIEQPSSDTETSGYETASHGDWSWCAAN